MGDVEGGREGVSAGSGEERCVVVQLVRVWLEFGVVVPVTGAQSVSELPGSVVIQCGGGAAGFTISASPLRPARGRVSCQFASVTGPVGSGPVPVAVAVSGAGCGSPDSVPQLAASAQSSPMAPAQSVGRRRAE